VFIFKLLVFSVTELVLLAAAWILLGLATRDAGSLAGALMLFCAIVLLIEFYIVGVRAKPLWDKVIAWTNTHPNGNHPQG
jgi:hypothetical protein